MCGLEWVATALLHTNRAVVTKMVRLSAPPTLWCLAFRYYCYDTHAHTTHMHKHAAGARLPL